MVIILYSGIMYILRVYAEIVMNPKFKWYSLVFYQLAAHKVTELVKRDYEISPALTNVKN